MRWLLGWAATAGLLQAAPGDAIALLKTKCLACHNAQVKQGGLDLSTREALLAGSEHGPVITAGLPAESQLYKVVAHLVEPGMPFKGKKLPDAEVKIFAEWVKAGAPYETAAANPDAELLSAAASHWAYRPPVRPPARSIDALLAAPRLKKGVTPVAPADPATLLRRLYLDLIGLPPPPRNSRPSWPTSAPTPTNSSSTTSLKAPSTPNAGAATGLTSGATPTGTATAKPARSATAPATSGAGAIGPSTASPKTNPTTA